MMFRLLIVAFVVVATVFSPGPAFAQETQSDADEIWYGILDVKVAKLRIELRLTGKAEGGYTATMVSLDQSSVGIACDSMTLDDKVLAFKITALGVNYSGTLNDKKDAAAGTFKQGGAEYPLTLKKVDKIPTPIHTQTWTGIMKAGPQEFDFQFRVFRDEDGDTSILLDSFTEYLSDIPCTIEHEGDQITIDVPVSAAEFVGTLSEDKKSIDGKWTQRGNSFDLVLKEIPIDKTRELGKKRPQTPVAPFDYDVEDVKIENRKDGVTLAGTLTSPKGDGPFPAVVMISGSGPQDRDETLMGHKPFFVIADYLTKRGFAVLRFDDRGTAESTGDFRTATSADFATDVEAIVDYLKTNQKIAADKIALCGHSEGGIIAPMVASRRDDIAAIVLLAGPGVTGRRISLNQSRLLMEVGGVPEYLIRVQETMLNGLFDQQQKEGELDSDFQTLLAEKMKALVPENERSTFDGGAMILLAVAQLQSPWFAYFAHYDPAPALEETKCSVLAIVGEKDIQVDSKLNMPVIERSLKEGGNQDYEIHVLPNLNHLFQNCNTGAVGEYARIEETFDPAALDLVASWLEERLQR